MRLKEHFEWADAAKENAEGVLYLSSECERLQCEHDRMKAALTNVVTDVKQMDGTCPYKTWAEARECLESLKREER
jgi:hypothetical protein